MQRGFYAIALIPIGEVTAISFLSPLFGTLGAIFLLVARVRIRRWTALLAGFMGAMIIRVPAGHSAGARTDLRNPVRHVDGLTAILISSSPPATTPTRSSSSPTPC